MFETLLEMLGNHSNMVPGIIPLVLHPINESICNDARLFDSVQDLISRCLNILFGSDIRSYGKRNLSSAA